MALILEITQQNGLVVRQPLDPNSAKITAQPGDKIRVIDAETGQPAGDLVARRVGDSLVVEQAGGATVELTEFFAPCAPGEGCELVLEDGDKTTTISQATEPMNVAADGSQVMYDGALAAQAGSAPAQEGAAAAAGTAGAAEGGAAGGAAAAGATNTGAIVAGIGAIGIAAAAGGGGGGGGGTPVETVPEAPVIDPVADGDGVDATEAAAGVTVSGTAEAGSTVTVVWSGAGDESFTQTTTAGEDGVWSVAFPMDEIPEDGATTITATAANAIGSSEATTVEVAVDTAPPADTTPPEAPVINDVAGDNIVDAVEAAAGVAVSGTAEEGSSVAVTWGETTQETTADSNGNWTTTFAQAAIPADGASTISATATDAAGNVSEASTLEVTIDTAADPGAPAAPVINAVATDSIVDATEAASNVTVSGTAEAGSTVTVVWGDITKPDIPVDVDGNWTVDFTPAELPAAGNTTIIATASNAEGEGDPGTREVSVESTVVTAGGDAGETLIGGAGTQTILGGDGNDILIGDSGGAVRNYQFDYWDIPADGAFLPGVEEGTQSEESWGGFTNAMNFGWTLAPAGTPANGNTSIETGGPFELQGNGLDFGPEDVTGTGGTHYWQTILNDSTNASGITQEIMTVAGESYTLMLQTSNFADDDTSLEIVWNGEVIAFYDGTTSNITNPANWVGPDGSAVDIDILPAVPGDNTRAQLSFTVEGHPTDDTSSLSVLAYIEPGSQGDGLVVDRITLDAISPAGNDVLNGGAGNDLLFGQAGDDILTGGAGQDTFVFSMRTDNGNDTITDFVVGEDRIMLVDSIDANTTGSTGPDFDTTPTSDLNLSHEDFLGTGNLGAFASQEIVISADGEGNLVLSFTGEGDAELGSVTLQGVDAASYTSVESLFAGANPIVQVTGDGFNSGLII